jgi:hypothetical protein
MIIGLSPSWEAGGGQRSATQFLTFRSDNSHDNGWPGTYR